MKDESIFGRRDGAGKGSGTGAQARGARGEALAARFLARRGMRIVARNYRCRQGEVDLVAKDGETLVFVEVRWRSGDRFGGAAESIDAHKLKRMAKAARHYLARKGADRPCRFDAVLIDGEGRTLSWLQDICWL